MTEWQPTAATPRGTDGDGPPRAPGGGGRRGRGRRVAEVALSVVVLLVVVAGGFAVWAVRNPFPQHEGTATLPALTGRVEVLRDEFGVAHVYADDPLDLYRAQGWVHAQDRFWQMDTWRHITAGRTAELFGPDQLSGDRFLRTLGWHRIAEDEYGRMGAASRAVFDAYADGVNAYVAGRSTGRLSLGYTTLGIQRPGYEPEPWDAVDSIAFLKLMAWDLRGNMDTEIERVVLAQVLDDGQLADVFPPYPAEAPVIVGDNDADLDARIDAERVRDVDIAAAVASVGERLAEASRRLGHHMDGLGSNSWVVAGDRTASGAPVIANDPHLGIGIPSIWYEVGLHCRTVSSSCPDDVAGFSFAGVPGVVIGHNDAMAWAFTNLGADVQDLYLERVHPDDPHRYEVEGEWRDMEVRTEVLQASDGTRETIEIRSTRNGPIISGRYGSVDEAVDDEYAVALRWTALQPGTTAEAIVPLNRARDWESFREAARLFEVPSQNLLYADTNGSIGYQAPGRIPIRSDAHDGLMPAPGWDDDYQWQGFVDFDALPRERDPERGWIVTANNAVVGDDYPYALSRTWALGYRARRIEELLGRAGVVDVAEVAADQLDEHDGSASFLLPHLLAVGADDDRVSDVQRLLDGWDRQARADSAAAAAYAGTWRHLLREMFARHLPDDYQPRGNSRWFEAVRLLLDEPDSGWWEPEGREGTLQTAMTSAHDELSELLGDDPDGWEWGALHTATFTEGTLGSSGIGFVERRFNRGPWEVGGGSAIVNATGWDASAGYEVLAAPSMRMVIDLGDLDRSRTIHTTGQSGHPYHPNYTDMTDLWAAGEQRAAVFTRPAVEAAATARLELVP